MSVQAANRPKLPFNGAVLRWAREHAHRTLDEAARRVQTTPEKVGAWEEGLDAPTVRQARLLAGLYERPFLEFFYDEPPTLPKPTLIPDFRLRRGAPDPREKEGLLAVQTWAEEQRRNALDLYETLGEPPPEFPVDLRATTQVTLVERVAARARAAIRFPISAQMALKSARRGDLPKILRQKLEAIGVLVLKNKGLAECHARGLCLATFPLPVIVFTNETPGAQAFTLVHELGHVILRQSAISGALGSSLIRKPGRHVEAWCNRFAGAFLIPEEALTRLRTKPDQPKDKIEDEALKEIANAFSVSPHAMLVRLVQLGHVKPSYYWRVKRPQFLEQEASYEPGGRSEYFGSRYRSYLGDLYTSLVLEALATGRITNHTASEFMGIKNLMHFEDIRDHFGT